MHFPTARPLSSALIPGCATLLSLASLAVQAQSYSGESITATSNIFGAGNSASPTPVGGTQAPGFLLNAGAAYVEFTSVTGTVSLTSGVSTVPDGVQSNGTAPFGISLDIDSDQGISGIRLDSGSGFLSGVFVSNTTPTNPAPTRLLFTNNGSSGEIATDFASLSPFLDQQFFIGDGLTGNGSGAIQKFYVPIGATYLYLGFDDGYSYSGSPGAYFDNSGALSVSFQAFGSSVPEPGTYALLGSLGLTGAGLLRRRRVRKAS